MSFIFFSKSFSNIAEIVPNLTMGKGAKLPNEQHEGNKFAAVVVVVAARIKKPVSDFRDSKLESESESKSKQPSPWNKTNKRCAKFVTYSAAKYLSCFVVVHVAVFVVVVWCVVFGYCT